MNRPSPHRLPLLAALTLSSLLSAQQPSQTLPPGFLASGGNAPSGRGTGTSFVFDASRIRYLERHAAWTGGGQRVLSGVAFRRPWGQPEAPKASARSMDLSLRLGLAAGNALSASGFGSNLQSSSVQQVFQQSAVALPDRRSQPQTIPAPWDLRLPFGSPYVYSGSADLCWEIECSKSSAASGTGYFCDRADGSSFLRTDSRRRQPGCGNQSLRARFYNYGPSGKTYQMRLYLDADQHPAKAAVTAALGAQALGVQLPGWCARVHPDPLAYLPLGTTSATGDLPGRYFNQPYLAVLEGLSMHLQSFAADPGQPAGLALSSGEQLLVPPAPAAAAQGFGFIYQTSPSASIKGPYSSGSVVTGWY